MRLGILSDTHGLLRPQAIAALAGAEHILHAGDVGDDAILDTLAAIAPLTVIRGNVDHHGRCGQLSPTEAIELAGKLFYLVHSVHDLDIDPLAAKVAAVISGHSHQPSAEQRNGVLYLNPGSAGPRRFSLPCTLVLLDIEDGSLTPTFVDLLRS